MQVTLEQPGGLERRLQVEVPEQQIAEQVKTRLQSVARSARIDGFRPGKAPPKVIERQFGMRVRNEVVSEVLRASFAEAVGTHQLRPVADPVIDPVSADLGQGLRYTATFEIFPEVVLAPVEGLRVERPECEVTEADLDKMVEVLREQAKTWQEVNRQAINGDQLLLDFEGTLEGETQPFENGSAKEFKLVLGQGRMISGFEDGLVGVNAGEQRTLNLQFPSEYHNAEFAGRGVSFAVSVGKVEASVLPEMNADFFERFGVKDGALASFRQEVRENMERERNRALERRFNGLVLERLRDHHTLELPKTLIRSECLRLQQEMLRTLARRGIDSASLGAHDDLSRFEASASNRVKLGLIMAEIIKHAGIKAQPAKIRARVEALAASYEQPEALLKWYYEEPQRLQEIEGLCLEEEAVEWVVERAQVTPISITFDDLMNPRQTAAETAAGDQ